MNLVESLSQHSILSAAIVVFLYVFVLSIYRLYFHPLRTFPGPRLAALTLWYEFYYDVYHRGQYILKIRSLHEKYGPIVRINPHEVHISTPEFYNRIYSSSQRQKQDRWAWSMKGFGLEHSVVSTLGHDLHHARRSAIAPLFAKTKAGQMQAVVQERVDALLGRLRESQDSGEIINLNIAFSAFSADIAMRYCFGRPRDQLHAVDFDAGFHGTLVSMLYKSKFMNHFPWIIDLSKTVVSSLPPWLLMKMLPKSSFMRLQKDIAIQARETLDQLQVVKDASPSPTIFQSVLTCRLPPAQKSLTRLIHEGAFAVGAATVSLSWTLTVGTWAILSQPACLIRLKAELHSVIGPNLPQVVDLKNLERQTPYLNATIQESLRLSVGTTFRSQRIFPNDALPFADPTTGRIWCIPAGTPVSMSHLLLLMNPTVFPDPHAFRPERWLEDPGLEKYQVAFSRGTRSCLGKELAYVELRLCFANLFMMYGSTSVSDEGDDGLLELIETDYEDIRVVGDGVVPRVREGTKGVRIRVRPKHVSSWVGQSPPGRQSSAE